MLDMNIVIGKTIKNIVHNKNRINDVNQSVTVYCTDGTSFIFLTSGGKDFSGEDWSTISLVED